MTPFIIGFIVGAISFLFGVGVGVMITAVVVGTRYDLEHGR